MDAIEKLIKQVTVKIGAIERGEITSVESKIGKIFNKLKTLDEPAYLKLLERYKSVLAKIKQNEQ